LLIEFAIELNLILTNGKNSNLTVHLYLSD
jgi:hypothetical protein